MVCELHQFPVGRSDGQVPVCEINGEVLYSSPEFINLHVYTSCVSEHPHVVISRDVLAPSLRKPYEGRVFLPTSDSLLQRLQDAWYEYGMLQVLQILSEENTGGFSQKLAKYLLTVYNSWNSVKNKAFPPTEERYIRDDKKKLGPVICMAWHPNTTRLALGTSDDSVSVYSSHTRITPVLKSKSQRRITDVAWRPLTAGELAVGCADGVNIWHVDTNSLVARPSPSTATLFRHPYVTSIAWSPQGDILISCNGVDNSMVIWLVDTKEKIVVPCAGGASLLLWNPSMSKLLAATRSKMFRLWSTEKWECENWTTAGGRVTAGAWSHDGSCLVFSTSSLPYLYSLQRGRSLFSDPPPAVIIADVTIFQIPGTDDVVGGDVRKIDWDGDSRHLAVMFSEGRHVAVYITTLGSTLTLIPGLVVLFILTHSIVLSMYKLILS